MPDPSAAPVYSAAPGTRRPYFGSCHCGQTKYVVFLVLPPPPSSWPDPANGFQQVFYRCNCTTCHKFAIMHVRLAHAPDDFLLLSPADGPLHESSGLGGYQCFAKKSHWFFCKNCGGRCFSFRGEGETVEVDLAELGVGGAEVREGLTRVWRPKKEGWQEMLPGGKDYLSVNGYSIDAGQEGFDLREWTEKKWVAYVDRREVGGIRQEPRLDQPQDGGAY